jgi:hypothetical protein
MNHDRDRALLEATRRNSFWVCLVVFAVLATDGGFRLVKLLNQRKQIDQMQLSQAANIGRMSSMLSQMPQIEAKLQAISIDLIQVARTNATAAQIVRDFNIQWNPGAETASPPLTNAPAPVSAPVRPAAPVGTNAAK